MQQLLPVTIALAFIAFLLSLWLFFMNRLYSQVQDERDHLRDELDEALIGKKALKEEIGRLLTITELFAEHKDWLTRQFLALEQQISQQQLVIPEVARPRGRPPKKERTVEGSTGEFPAITVPRTPSQATSTASAVGGE